MTTNAMKSFLNYFTALTYAIFCVSFIITKLESNENRNVQTFSGMSLETRTSSELSRDITPPRIASVINGFDQSTAAMSPGILMSAPGNVSKVKAVVLAKTHKTAGSTLAAIIQRFGINNNLTFALPKKLIKFGETPLTPDMLVAQPPDGGFHMLVNHVPFNKTSVQNVVKSDAKYVTILRDPVTHFYSASAYYSLVKRTSLAGDIYSPDFPLSVFLSKVAHCDICTCKYTYNGQAFDLGQFHNESNLSTAEVNERIDLIEKQFDLVLLRDYFDESLILLRKLLNWSFTDISYIPKKIRGPANGTKSYPRDHVEMIKKWNYVDVMLYEHFKTVLKKRIAEYGPTFGEDLRKFKRVKEKFVQSCMADRQRRICRYLKMDVGGLTSKLIKRENETLHRIIHEIRTNKKKSRDARGSR